MDRFEDMRTFVEVADAGSISAAAERLHRAKSAVSRRIADLEDRLGAQLFRRTTRALNLTDTGRGYLERCRRILEDVAEAELAVSRDHGTLRGQLRVAAPMSFGLKHLGPAINEFQERHPQVTFDLDLNDRQVDVMAEGFDLALRIADLPDSSLVARRLAPVRMVLCASPTYLANRGIPNRPQDLADHDCLSYTNLPDPTRWVFREPAGDPGSVRIHPQIAANNGDFLLQAAIAGRGIAYQPTFIAFEPIRDGQLVPVLEDYDWPGVNAYVIYPQSRHLSQRVRAFVDFLAERFAGTPYWDRAIQEPDGPGIIGGK